MVPREPIPVPLIAAALQPARVANHALDLALALDELQAEAFRRVERNMAVHDPRAWVIRGEGQQHVAVAGQRRCVATGRVVEVETGGAAIPDASAPADDVVTRKQVRILPGVGCGGDWVTYSL